MKGYSKSLKEFMAYICKKYAKDEKVKEFREVYEQNESDQKAKRALAYERRKDRNATITISGTTAEVCEGLVRAELYKNEIMGNLCYEAKTKLELALDELQNGCESVADVLKRIRQCSR